MTELEKVIAGLECCVLRDPDDKHRCDVCPYNPSKYDEISNSPCVNGLKAQALALLKERGPKVKPQFDDDALDRNAYIKVGDLIDCMTELSMPEDAAFHLTGAIEWACGKRAVALPKEQEARVVTTADFENNPNLDDIGSGHLNVWEEYKDSTRSGWNTINVNDVRAFTDIRRYWTSRPSPEQMANTPWEVGETDG
ncbi:MAG: hypothetical protein II680_05060 [Clostridia bacterium]|nr:hypothetical protein [Clostridia bacterium]